MPVPMPLLRLQALSGNLYAPCLGRAPCSATRMPILWEADRYVGIVNRDVLLREGWDYQGRLDAVLRFYRQWEGKRE